MAGVKTQHKSYQDYQAKWKRVRDILAGEDAVYAGGYLPKLAKQEDWQYASYLTRTPFVNFSWRVVDAFVGMIFRKDAKIVVPAKVEPLLEDVTLSGVPFKTLLQDVVLENLSPSRVALFVDHPQIETNEDGTPKRVSTPEAEKRGLRPTMQIYKTESIINWRRRLVDNKYVLSLVVLAEKTYEEGPTKFEPKEVDQYRVLELDGNNQYCITLYDENEQQKGNIVYPLMNGKRMNFIPFYPMGPNGLDIDVEEPILIDLFNLNLKHFFVSADYENGCHITALPTPYITGYQTPVGPDGKKTPQEMYIGSGTAWMIENDASKVGMLEYTGQGLTAVENNLNSKEAQMAAIASKILAPDKGGVEAYKTVAMKSSGENSVLSNISISTSSGVQAALQTFSDWAGGVGKVEVELNKLFLPVPMDAQTMGAYLAAVVAGRISPETYHEQMQNADVIPSDVDYETEQARIEAFMDKQLAREKKEQDTLQPPGGGGFGGN